MNPKRFKLTPYPVSHQVKSHPEAFSAVWGGEKTHEIRFNDRRYQFADTVRLKEWNPDFQAFTGRAIDLIITHIRYSRDDQAIFFKPVPFSDGLKAGFCIFDFAVLNQYGGDDGRPNAAQTEPFIAEEP
jgi:hypothetical protein